MDRTTSTMAIQIDKFVKKVFKLLLEFKNEGKTNNNTPTI